MKIKLEYIWLDGNLEEPSLRSKTKVVNGNELSDEFYISPTEFTPKLETKTDSSWFFFTGKEMEELVQLKFLQSLPQWTFDGSSTKQAEGDKSDCILKPVRVVPDPTRNLGYLVMCEVLNADGTPHRTNTRNPIEEYLDENNKTQMWFGFEQEYVINNPETGKPLGFPKGVEAYPNPQGPFYCGVGNVNVKARSFVEDHMDLCLQAGLNITGINGEVMIGQWEYQLLGIGAKNAGDELWLSRYLLQRLGEEYGFNVTFHPKPVKGDWNGSGMHCNFSSRRMRELDIVPNLYDQFKKHHKEDIKSYGAYNELRLTGLHETASIEKFSVGVSDRGASIRIPIATERDGKGYLEDRRPASNADPYKLVQIITNNVANAEKLHLKK